MRKKYSIIIIVVLLIIIIGFPILINNQIGNELKAEDWLSFLGSYGGALIGFLGIILTILYTKISLKEEKRLEVKPYIYFKEIQYSEEYDIEYIKGNTLTYLWNDTVNIYYPGETHIKGEKSFYFKLDNIGLGHMVDCELLGITSPEDGYYYLGIKEYIGTIRKGESIEKFKLGVSYHISDKEVLNLNKTYSLGIDAASDSESFTDANEFIRKNTLKEIVIEFEYKDILSNKYKKAICLNFYLEYRLSVDDEQRIVLSDIKPCISINEEKSKEKLIKKS